MKSFVHGVSAMSGQIRAYLPHTDAPPNVFSNTLCLNLRVRPSCTMSSLPSLILICIQQPSVIDQDKAGGKR